MREIKFRAWDKEGGRMFEVFGLDVNHVYAWLKTDEAKINYAIPPHRNECILMQYTGLKTDTNREVYEGDILVIPNLIANIHNHVDTIVFSNGTFRLEKCKDIIVCQELMDEGVSIIGNIYQNPEWLEVVEC